MEHIEDSIVICPGAQVFGDVELSEKGKNKEVAVETTSTITKKQTSLI